MTEIKMVVTDLDGTLLQSDHTISEVDRQTLIKLGKMGVCRVAATGRNLVKLRMALTTDSPFDYAIFSSGAGIIDWKTQKLIKAISISKSKTAEIIDFLISEKQNFKVSMELPDNNNFGWLESYPCAELKRYIEIHSSMGEVFKINPNNSFVSAQFLLFFQKSTNDFEIFKEKIQNKFADLSIIKTTSPLSDEYIWMEIFPNTVSKAHGIEEVCRVTGILRENTFSIGNDYNDLEMLEFTQHSYVVDNAPEELKMRYLNSLAHHENGFSFAVNKHI